MVELNVCMGRPWLVGSSGRERKMKEDFCDYQRGLGGSYMRTAVTTLALLLELESDDDVAAAFLAPSLVCRRQRPQPPPPRPPLPPRFLQPSVASPRRQGALSRLGRQCLVEPRHILRGVIIDLSSCESSNCGLRGTPPPLSVGAWLQ